MDMWIKLQPHKAEFAITAFPAKATDFEIHFHIFVHYVDRLEMNPSVISGYTEGLKSHNALYPINHTELSTYKIPAGQLSYTKDHLFPDMAPKTMIVPMVENAVYNGEIGKSPLNF